MRKLKWMSLLMLGSIMAPALAQEHPQDVQEVAVSVECLAMQGAYAVATLVNAPRFSEYVAEIGDPSIAIGETMFVLGMSDEGMTRTGVVSGQTLLLKQARNVPSQRLFEGATVACALKDAELHNDLQIIHADLSEMSAQKLKMLADYLGAIWEAKVDPKALRKLSDFLVVDASMTGVADMFIIVPLKKL